MSQHDFDIANDVRVAVRADLNSALKALASLSSGPSAPATTFAGQLWLDTADTNNPVLKIRNEANTTWIVLFSIGAAGMTLNAVNLLRGGSQVYSRNNILGTVTQSGGVPTGAIIESGSNANGEYIRFANGHQICIHEIDETAFAWNVSTGSLWRSSQGGWTYPAAFVAKPKILATVESSIVAAFGVHADNPTSTVTNWRGWSSISQGPGTAKRVILEAHGKWF